MSNNEIRDNFKTKPTFGKKKVGKAAWFYILPSLAFVGIVVLYPLISNIIISLQTDQQLIRTGNIKFVGFANYIGIWKEGLLQISFRNSLVFTLITVFFAFIIGFGIAILLNYVKSGSSIYRVTIVLPWVISPIVAGFTWRWLFNDTFGYINYTLKSLGITSKSIVWLGDQRMAFAAVSIAQIWRFFPFMMIMLLAGLKNVEKDQLEAASIDGAGPLQRFIHITIPQMKDIIIIVILLSFIWNFNEFGLIQVMTNGGPLNSTMVIPVLIQRLAFLNFRLGTGAAMSIVLTAILLILSILYLKFVGKKD